MACWTLLAASPTLDRGADWDSLTLSKRSKPRSNPFHALIHGLQLAPQVRYPRFCRAVGNQNPERPSSTRATDVSSLGWVGRPSAWEAASSPRPFDPPRESA